MSRALLVLLSAASLAFPAWHIAQPLGSASAIALPESAFTALVETDSALVIDSAALESPFLRIPLSMSVTEEEKSYDPFTGRKTRYTLFLTVPAGSPEDIYDLKVYSGDSSVRTIRSVVVIKAWVRPFRIVHITDSHLGNTWRNGRAGELEYLKPLLEVINIISPDLVVLTGDNLDNTLNYTPPSDSTKPATVKEVYDNLLYGADTFPGVKDLNAPVFMAPGNHDYRNVYYMADDWNKYLGPRVYGFHYSTACFLVMDDYLGHRFPAVNVTDFPDSQTAFLWNWYSAQDPGKIRILLEHQPGEVRDSVMTRFNVRLALSGHTHSNGAYGQIFTTASASHYNYVGVANTGWMRVLTISDSTIAGNTTLQYGNPSAKIPSISLIMANANNGTAVENSAVIVNNSSLALPRTKVRFIMSRGEYAVDSATLLQSFGNDSVSVYDATVSLLPGRSKTVRIQRSDAVEKRPSRHEVFRTGPNPFNGHVTFSVLEKGAARIRVTDVRGSIVFSRNGLGPEVFSWKPVNQATGVYLVTCVQNRVRTTRAMFLLE